MSDASLRRDTALPGDVVRIALPTPLPVGKVNCWLLEGDPLTLVDAGPYVAESFAALEAGLGERGVRIEDIELLVLSHQHMDHVGNASAVVERSGCPVAAHELLAPRVANLHAARDAESDYQDAIMELHGTPVDRRRVFWEHMADRKGYWNASVEVGLVLAEGDAFVAGGRSLRVAHRPGHSPTDTMFLDDASGVAIVADHLLPHISSNPLAALPPSGSADPRDRVRSLPMYLHSLEQTAAEEIRLALPGHGRPIDDHRALIDSRRRAHVERMEELAAVLGDRTMTAREIADAFWPRIAINQTYLTLCESLGALDLLEERARVRQELRDGVVVWEALEP